MPEEHGGGILTQAGCQGCTPREVKPDLRKWELIRLEAEGRVLEAQ